MLEWLNKELHLNLNPFFAIQVNSSSEDQTNATYNGKKDRYFTGYNDSKLLNQYNVFRGEGVMKYWNSSNANLVAGSDGRGFKIDIKGNESLLVFSDQLYRKLNFKWNDTTLLENIPVNHYLLDTFTWANSSMGNPDYFLNAPSGLLNFTSVVESLRGAPAPIFLSLPLFLHADRAYLQDIELLPPHNQPNPTEHDIEIFVEPLSGITLKAAKRIQFNVKLDPTFLFYHGLKVQYLPVVWFELTTQITGSLAREVVYGVVLAEEAIRLSVPVMSVLAVVTGLGAVACFYLAYVRRDLQHHYVEIQN
eukprot:TRINITY_DN1689_c0_g1_i2.p1 TRINITY_DN1689_c0_g1~~TRINITY_DN1689_c0_g1_i2.p1  ORF type:complete len:306 (+),score=53.99 TRINITY_DN1689_c0_g1_i2:874-1791(+)